MFLAIRKILGMVETSPSAPTHLVTATEEVVPRQQPRRNLPKPELGTLPAEILLLIMKHEEMDPVTRIVLGLTCREMYGILREVMEKGDLKTYLWYPTGWFFDLNMQVTTTGAINNWWMYDEWRFIYGIVTPYPKLLDLIKDERLFDGLHLCHSCNKFKPDTAYRSLELEEMSRNREGNTWWDRDEKTMAEYSSRCRRCRAACLLMEEMGLEEYVQEWDSYPKEVKRSRGQSGFRREYMGLKNLWQNEAVPLKVVQKLEPRCPHNHWDNAIHCDYERKMRDYSVRDPEWFERICKNSERRCDAYEGNYIRSGRTALKNLGFESSSEEEWLEKI
ncbi:hypothetical protein PVAG01_03594 [Phlyctema vagabunda]|uniref:F-box domain-containing protein n=1 Tax=Phlyctema vagabunda TaxID=108571 RepID=A0ABR4PM47_9HELO